MKGYHYRLIWVDLSRRRIETRPLAEKDAEMYIGGGGLGALILSRLVNAGTDPLGPDNPLIFTTGPFTATRVPAGSRHEVIGLSPLTGIYGESNCGGAFGYHFKRAGYDGLVITGASPEPVSLIIDGDDLSLEPALDLWGKTVFETDQILRTRYDQGGVTAAIGPAGERLVSFASISHDGRATRAAGRCGFGAVMGAKKIKAILVTSRGQAQIPIADPEGLRRATRAVLPVIKEKLQLFSQFGTTGGVAGYHKLGNLPINNWRDARAPEIAERTTGTTMKETIWVSRAGCKACPIQCGRLVENQEGPFALDGRMEGPEYETLAVFGTLCLNGSLEAIAKANEICNTLGLDTISAGSVLAFAMECVEKGVLGPDDLEGVDLGFGKPEGMIEMLGRIGRREGALGRLLGQGVRAAARTIGRGAEEFAVETKGLEYPMHDPRFSWGHALSYATSNRGACHCASLSHMFEIGINLPELGYEKSVPGRQQEGKAAFTAVLQNLMTLLDSLVECKFAMINNTLTVTNFLDFYNCITGRGIKVEEFLAAGERAFNLKRTINNQRGVTRKDDMLPPRFRTLRKKGEEIDFGVPPLLPLLSDYYDVRGWTEEGRPLAATLERLGIGAE